MKRKVFDAEFIRKYGILMVLVIMWVIMLDAGGISYIQNGI